MKHTKMEYDRILKEHVDQRHKVWAAVNDRPFKLALAVFAIYSGISGLAGFGSSNEIFSFYVAYPWLFHSLFIASGLLVGGGVLAHKTNIEAAGLLLVSTSMVSRFIIIIMTSGWQPQVHNILALSIIFTIACAIRIASIYLMNKMADKAERS